MTGEEATSYIRGIMPLCETLGIRGEICSADSVVLSIDWAPALCTAGAILHGGVIMSLADSAGGVCALLNLPDGATGTATVESKTNFLGAVRAGTVTATSTPLHRGGTTIVVETAVRDSAARLVAKVTQTQIVLRPAR